MISHRSMEKITEKEWTVLLYFIERESSRPEGSESCGHFLAYPAKIERDLNREVTRGWAAEICASLEGAGILGHAMLRPPRQRYATEHYFVRDDREALQRIVGIVMERTGPKERLAILSYRYFRDAIDERLVREVLSTRGAEMRRTLGLLEWDDRDARALFQAYMGREGIDGKVEWEPHVRALLRGELEAGEPWSGSEISLRLPVFADSVPPEERARAFESLNREELAQYPFISFGSSGVRQHYERREHEALVLPLLALARASPGALNELLNGGWKPFDAGQDPLSFTSEGTEPLEHLIFSMLFIAIGDLAATRSVPESGAVGLAWLRRSNNVICDTGQDALLTVRLEDGTNVYFDGGFDTLHAGLPEAGGTAPQDDLGYWVRTWTGFGRASDESQLFFRPDIADPEGLVAWLAGGTLLARALSGRCSFETQRLLACYGSADRTLRDRTIDSLLDELNRLVVAKPLYDRALFRDVALSGLTRRMAENDAENKAGYVTANRRLLTEALAAFLKK